MDPHQQLLPRRRRRSRRSVHRRRLLKALVPIFALCALAAMSMGVIRVVEVAVPRPSLRSLSSLEQEQAIPDARTFVEAFRDLDEGWADDLASDDLFGEDALAPLLGAPVPNDEQAL